MRLIRNTYQIFTHTIWILELNNQKIKGSESYITFAELRIIYSFDKKPTGKYSLLSEETTGIIICDSFASLFWINLYGYLTKFLSREFHDSLSDLIASTLFFNSSTWVASYSWFSFIQIDHLLTLSRNSEAQAPPEPDLR